MQNYYVGTLVFFWCSQTLLRMIAYFHLSGEACLFFMGSFPVVSYQKDLSGHNYSGQEQGKHGIVVKQHPFLALLLVMQE